MSFKFKMQQPDVTLQSGEKAEILYCEVRGTGEEARNHYLVRYSDADNALPPQTEWVEEDALKIA